MSGFRLESTRIMRCYTIEKADEPMRTESGRYFWPVDVDISMAFGEPMEVEFTGSPCTSDGTPTAVHSPDESYPRRRFGYVYFKTDRSAWPTILRELVEHAESLEG